MRLGMLLLLACLVLGCTRPDHARSVLEAEGYTQVEITGFRFWTCGNDDTFATGFRAIGPSGKQVTGTVCEGWVKGATVRLD